MTEKTWSFMGNYEKYCPRGPKSSPIDKIAIDEPPCKTCRFFQPCRLTDQFGRYAGIRLCIAEKMYPDFSCHVNIEVTDNSHIERMVVENTSACTWTMGELTNFNTSCGRKISSDLTGNMKFCPFCGKKYVVVEVNDGEYSKGGE